MNKFGLKYQFYLDSDKKYKQERVHGPKRAHHEQTAFRSISLQ